MQINVNQKQYSVNTSAETTLLNVLREKMRLTGTKCGCDIGVCGTCTVLINGVAKRACIVKVSQLAETDEITTIEGVSEVGAYGHTPLLHPVQQAFIDAGAIQCGFCTPGMVMTAIGLLNKNSKPSRDEIKKAFATNLCRCTGYQQIFEAVELASKRVGE